MRQIKRFPNINSHLQGRKPFPKFTLEIRVYENVKTTKVRFRFLNGKQREKMKFVGNLLFKEGEEENKCLEVLLNLSRFELLKEL